MPRTGNGANAITSQRMRDRATDWLAGRKELTDKTSVGNLGPRTCNPVIRSYGLYGWLKLPVSGA